MRDAAERLRWAVERLAVRPGERLYEIGCGHGVAVALLSAGSGAGRIVACDRSVPMVEAARRRNAAAIAAGRVAIHHGAVEALACGDEGFDTVFACNVPPFLRGDPAPVLTAVSRLLTPGGRLCLFHGAPLTMASGFATTLDAALAGHGFAIEGRIELELQESRVGMVAARRRPEDGRSV